MTFNISSSNFDNDDFELDEDSSGDLVLTHKDSGATFKYDSSESVWIPSGGLGSANNPVSSIHSDSVNAEGASIGPSGDTRDWGDRIDLYCVAGQSNAEGQGTAANSPTPESDNLLWYDVSADSLKLLDDPVGTDDDGSAWPAFGIRYREVSGVPVCIVTATSGGSAMTPGADTGGPNWYTDSSLPQNITQNVGDAYTALRDVGYLPNFRGILWAQGERDAQAIDNSNTTKQAYIDEFINDGSATGDSLITYLDADRGFEPWQSQEWKLFILETGTDNTGDTTGYREIRQAQREIADASERVEYASGMQVTFPGRGWMADDVHYNQTGLNYMGRHAAQRIVGGDGSPYIDGVGNVTKADLDGKSFSHGTSNSEKLTVTARENLFDQFLDSGNRFVAEWDGEYRVTVQYAWSNSIPDGMVGRCSVTKNGVSDTRVRDFQSAGASSFLTLGTTKTVELTAGDDLRVLAEKDDASAHDILGNTQDTFVEVEYVGQPA